MLPRHRTIEQIADLIARKCEYMGGERHVVVALSLKPWPCCCGRASGHADKAAEGRVAGVKTQNRPVAIEVYRNVHRHVN